MAVTPPPSKKEAKTEKEIEKIISKGGSPTNSTDELTELRSISIKLTDQELSIIKAFREQRPRPRGSQKRLGVSLHDWIVEAVQEKIARESKKSGLNVDNI